MNLNKLFPRLSIHAKLGIAFAALALVPLALVALVTTRVTIVRLRAIADATVEYDIERSRSEVERALDRLEEDVDFAADVLRPEILQDVDRISPAAAEALGRFMGHAVILFRVQVIGPDGTIWFTQTGGRGAPEEDDRDGTYYAWRAGSLASDERLLMPVEVRAAGPDGDGLVPAVAVLVPIVREDGLAAVVVGEADAAGLFIGLQGATPALPGITALIDGEGRLLYHSERKRDWANLLQEGGIPELGSPDYLTRTVPLALAAPTAGPLSLARAVPLDALNAPVRQFVRTAQLLGLATIVVVAVLAVLAARQFTRPLYALRGAAARLAAGEELPSLAVETNDELEDLARAFTVMAETLSRHRRDLEQLVEERTRQLQRTDAELGQVLQHSADAIVGVDAAANVRVWNRGAEALFGWPAAEAVGRPLAAVLPAPAGDRSAEAAFIARELGRHGAVVNLRTERLARDGRRVPVSLTQTLIRDAAGQSTGQSLILRDASTQERFEDHMRRSERLAAVSVMAAGLAHEINNPLAIIGNRLECMEAEVRDLAHETLERDLAVLREHTTRLGELTRDLLRFARDQDGGAEPVRLDEVARRVGGLLERTLVGRNVVVDVQEATLPAVAGSAAALETVCMNLLLNAADAMPAGGRITVTPRCREEAVELVVTDDGPGVPAPLRERIFEPFFTTKGPQRGTGLGLSVCRSIVERHGGRIWVEAAGPAGGARFVVRLPRTDGAPA